MRFEPQHIVALEWFLSFKMGKKVPLLSLKNDENIDDIVCFYKIE